MQGSQPSHPPLADVRHVPLRDGLPHEGYGRLVAQQVPHAVRGQDDELRARGAQHGEDAHLNKRREQGSAGQG